MIQKSKHSGNYTVIPNEIREQGLSLTAIGLMTYLLSLPHDWVIYKSKIYTTFPEGRARIDKAWEELVDAGYIISAQKIDSKGKFTHMEHVVYDKPFNNECKKPIDGKPTVGKQHLQKKESTKENITKEIFIAEQKSSALKESSNYKLFIEKWFSFFEAQGLPKPVMNGVQGKSMKALVTYFEARSKEKGSNPVEAFEYVLNHWNDLEEWMQTAALDLKVFASKLNSILSQIKNGSRTKQSVVQNIVARAKGSEYFDKL